MLKTNNLAPEFESPEHHMQELAAGGIQVSPQVKQGADPHQGRTVDVIGFG